MLILLRQFVIKNAIDMYLQAQFLGLEQHRLCLKRSIRRKDVIQVRANAMGEGVYICQVYVCDLVAFYELDPRQVANQGVLLQERLFEVLDDDRGSRGAVVLGVQVEPGEEEGQFFPGVESQGPVAGRTLHFDVDTHGRDSLGIQRQDKLDGLLQGGHLEEAIQELVAACPGLLKTEGTQFLKGEVEGEPVIYQVAIPLHSPPARGETGVFCHVGGVGQPGLVGAHHLVVLGKHHICLNVVAVHEHPCRVSRQGMFRQVATRSSVGNNQRPARLLEVLTLAPQADTHLPQGQQQIRPHLFYYISDDVVIPPPQQLLYFIMDYRQIEQEKLLLKKEIQYLKEKKKEKQRLQEEEGEKQEKSIYQPKSELCKIQGILFQSEEKNNLAISEQNKIVPTQQRAATVRSQSKSSLGEMGMTKSHVGVSRPRQPSINSSFQHYQQEQKSRISREVSTKSLYLPCHVLARPPAKTRPSHMNRVAQLQTQCREDYEKGKERLQRGLANLLRQR